jgi:protein-S-isoprenylcysteine O-methyltransferase Ste14
MNRLYRTARVASPARNVAKTFGSIVVTWGALLVVVPFIVTLVEQKLGVPRFDLPGQRFAAIALFLGGTSIGLGSAWFMSTLGEGTPFPFDAASKLVIVGPYRWVRNPMAIGGVAQSVAVACFFGSPITFVYSIAAMGLWNWMIRPSEERFLHELFGDAFERYRSDVRCWIPRRSPVPSNHP